LSINRRKIVPSRKPKAAGTHGIIPQFADISMAGDKSDQKLAASITPAAKPSMASNIFWLNSFAAKTSDAPAAVKAHVKIPAINA
jgi:hypothetical protein